MIIASRLVVDRGAASPLGLLFLLSTLGCERDHGPPLMDLVDVTPRDIELGDRVELRGSGFPQGRTARVAFEGTVHRPGERASSLSAETDGVVASPERIDVVVGEALEQAFCGRGEMAGHATFEGNVTIAFASSIPGAPPILASLRAITLDVRPASIRSNVAEARRASGEQLLSFLGVVPGPASGRGIPVERIQPGSPGERADLQVGDVIASIDGAHVAGVFDLLPTSARSIDVVVRRGEPAVEDHRRIPLVGYASDRIPVEYASALLVVGLALALLVLLVVPSPASLRVVEMRIASRLRDRQKLRFGKDFIFAGLASLLIGTFALGQDVVDADLDGPLLLVVAIALLATARIAGAAKGGKKALGALFETTSIGFLLTAAALGLVMTCGAMQLAELARIQGGAPWEFMAARRPAAALLAVGYLFTMWTLARAKVGAPSLAARPNVVLLERLGWLFASALAVALFFGGFRVPGLEPRSLSLHLVAASLFVAKTWALALAVRGAAGLASPWTTGDLVRFVLRRILPVLALGAGAALLSRRFAPGSSFELAFGATLTCAFVLLVLRSALRVRDALARPEPQASPFL